MADRPSSWTRSLQRFATERPVATSLVLMAIALCFKIIDTFVLRLDERVGEIILSKALGFGLVLLFLWAVRRGPSAIGLHSRRLGPSLIIGVTVTVLALVAGYGVEFAMLQASGSQPAFYLGAIDPKAGVMGGLLFALWLVVGNFINSSMEEGLYRGVMLRLFRIKLTAWRANWLQAALFGAWHLPWVLKWYQTGRVETGGEILMALFSNFVPQVVMGLVWGYMYLKTDSLWTPWVAHTIANSTSNVLHVSSLEGLNTGMQMRMGIVFLVSLPLMFLVKAMAQRYAMPEMRAWEDGRGSEE